LGNSCLHGMPGSVGLEILKLSTAQRDTPRFGSNGSIDRDDKSYREI
jgi:hypothetical protein